VTKGAYSGSQECEQSEIEVVMELDIRKLLEFDRLKGIPVMRYLETRNPGLEAALEVEKTSGPLKHILLMRYWQK
jgi:hypothetical protein